MYLKFMFSVVAITWSLAAPLAVQAQIKYADVVKHYASLVHANYSDAHAAAIDMQAKITAFISAPSAEGLEKARKAWVAAREYYGQTEAFRFYGGPIDDEKGLEGQINAWPLDEAYVDAVEGKTNSGLINNSKFKINKTNLQKLNERGGEENISVGWHAIEFLLWGQDQSETGAGNRSFEDFVDGKKANADRRRQYLSVATELLVDNLSLLVKAWEPGKKNYRAKFEQGGKESVRKIIAGLSALSSGELAGERMEVALNSQDQEDEQSCFSDNTHRDIVTNAMGIRNVWHGEYHGRNGLHLRGPSLRELVAANDKTLAAKTTAQLDQSVKAAEAIPVPFDRAIIGNAKALGRQQVQATIDSLVEQSKLLVFTANAVGISKLTQVQP